MVQTLYKSFVQIVESDTLVTAAQVLHTTQPTLTRQVQQLEFALGIKLFDRMGKKLVLNRAGELAYQYAKRLLSMEDRMHEDLNAFMNPDEGTVYIGAGVTPSIYMLPPLFAKYRTQYPNVRFQITTGSSEEVLTSLLQREIDIGVVTTFRDEDIDICAIPLMEDELHLVAPVCHPLTQVASATLADVAEYPFVLMRQGSGLRKIVHKLADEHGVLFDIVMETDNLESLNRFVQHGVGLSILPRTSIQDDVGAGRLCVVPIRDATLGARTILLITRKSSQLPAVAAKFVEVLPSLVES